MSRVSAWCAPRCIAAWALSGAPLALQGAATDVDGDPLTDIHTLERPTLVLQSGAIVRDELPRPAP